MNYTETNFDIQAASSPPSSNGKPAQSDTATLHLSKHDLSIRRDGLLELMHNDKIVLDRFAQGIIRRKARLLASRAGFTKQDHQDLEQELVLRLLQSLDLFDPEQAHPNVFITTVIERSVAMILRERRAKKRDGGVVRSLDQSQTKDGNPVEPKDPHPGDQEAFDLASDLAEVLTRLPDKLSALAERLKRQSLSQVARDLGLPRTTLQRQVQRLRKCFEDAGLRIYL
jgi:RNA polymerase sigma factor (sigma-70 family)